VMLAVSGGKDSLSMVRLLSLKNRQLPKPMKCTFVALHVNFGFSSQDKGEYAEFMKEYGIEYHVVETELPKKTKTKLSDCFWCSWNRRKILFQQAEKLSCPKIALAHNLDDIVETFLMNQFYYGELSTMPPNISLFEGKLRIIRPLAYLSEKMILEYATATGLPFRKEQCPYFSENKRRAYIKELVKDLEKRCPYVKVNIYRSMQNIKKEYLA
jgi:tRNA 2-thiocytidine biosynthesis protein TtcA